MGARVGSSSRSGWFVSIPLGWLVIGVLVLGGGLVAAVAGGGAWVVGHPGTALIGAAKAVAFFAVVGGGLYGFCWLLAHKRRHR